jgi:uncharacterized damage-inducible protein DinB
MRARNLLIDNHAHIPALSVLEGLTAYDADRRIAHAPYSIAEIAAHLVFWQEWFCGRCDGSTEPLPPCAALRWPAPAPGSWDTVRARFAAGLEHATARGNGDTARPISPPIEYPPLAAIRDAIEHMAAHNSHHLGQIVLLRQDVCGRNRAVFLFSLPKRYIAHRGQPRSAISNNEACESPQATCTA